MYCLRKVKMHIKMYKFYKSHTDSFPQETQLWRYEHKLFQTTDTHFHNKTLIFVHFQFSLKTFAIICLVINCFVLKLHGTVFL
jgi:hypothetical protein